MVEIPENPIKYDFEAKVNEATIAVLKGLERDKALNRRLSPNVKHYGTDCLRLNHARSYAHIERGELPVTEDVAYEVAKRFKAKGYFCRWCRAQNGVIFALSVKTYHENNDI